MKKMLILASLICSPMLGAPVIITIDNKTNATFTVYERWWNIRQFEHTSQTSIGPKTQGKITLTHNGGIAFQANGPECEHEDSDTCVSTMHNPITPVPGKTLEISAIGWTRGSLKTQWK